MRHIVLDGLMNEDLQESHRKIVDAVGLDTFIILSENFGGTPLYMPKLDDVLRNYRHRRVTEEFNGYNIQQLALKYDLSERTVYRIVQDKIDQMKASPFEGQQSLFE